LFQFTKYGLDAPELSIHILESSVLPPQKSSPSTFGYLLQT
jgi:hypothetical protein